MIENQTKWSGPLHDLIQVNLNLYIDLDTKRLSMIERLLNEIWVKIMTFLFLYDIFKLKFLSRRFNEIFLLNKEARNFIELSKKIFCVDDYYNKFIFLLKKKLLMRVKKRFDHSTFLFLNYSVEEIINECTISNCLIHLFHCPRSTFPRNNCLYCSRTFVKHDIFVPNNFNSIVGFEFEDYFLFDQLYSNNENVRAIIKDFKFNLFFASTYQSEVINSDRSRCLDLRIIHTHEEFVLLFFETQVRIFINFFYRLSEDIANYKERKFFIEKSVSFTLKFLRSCAENIKISAFEDFYKTIEHSQFQFMQVMNKKYIETCKKKYED